MTERVYLGLGSNLGERAANLWEAVRRVQRLPGCQVRQLSPLYESEPVGYVDQPCFLNAVLGVDVTMAPHELLQAVKGIERQMGRRAGERWGRRVIDIDLLIYGNVALQSERLTLPHPELWNRRFVLLPLKDVLGRGVLRKRVTARLRELSDEPGVRPLGI